jgi:hypothetical protein
LSIHRAATHNRRRPGRLILPSRGRPPSQPAKNSSPAALHLTLSPLLPSLSLDRLRPHPRHQGKPAHTRCLRRTRTRPPAPPHPHGSHRRRRLIRLWRIPRPGPNDARVGVLPAARRRRKQPSSRRGCAPRPSVRDPFPTRRLLLPARSLRLLPSRSCPQRLSRLHPSLLKPREHSVLEITLLC